VGKAFISHWKRLQSQHERTLSASGNLTPFCHPETNSTSGEVEDSESSSSDEEEEEVTFDDDLTYLRSLDPKEVKEQDHYRVLGISKLRIKATEEQIRKAYRYQTLLLA